MSGISIVVVALFVALLFFNLYFRIKLLKGFKYLIRNKVQFGIKHILIREKLEEEVLNRYPTQRNEIIQFVHLLKRAILIATILLVLIAVAGFTIFGGAI